MSGMPPISDFELTHLTASIAARVQQPSPAQVRQARENVGLTQGQAAQMVSMASVKSYRTWQNYETPVGRLEHRAIPLAVWELFLLLTNQHPTHGISPRDCRPG